MSETEMIAQLFVFFLAGYETTATTVTVILNFLAKHPQYIEKIRKEAQQEIIDMNRFGFRHSWVSRTTYYQKNSSESN